MRLGFKSLMIGMVLAACGMSASGPRPAQTLPVVQVDQTRIVPTTRSEITLSFAPVVKQAAPAVVNIYTKKVVQRRASPFAGDPFFERFFRDMFPANRSRKRIENSLGSGVILDASGIVVSNYHVVGDADEITVILQDRREYEGRVILADKESDLAVLQLEDASNLPTLAIRDSDSLEVGDLVLAIGNPFGVGQTVTSGIISGLTRSGGARKGGAGVFIQTDAAINPGNSGGALVDMEGRLVGVNTAILSPNGGSIGIGFSMASNVVTKVVAQLKEFGETRRGWLGVSVQDLTPDLTRYFKLARSAGVLVTRVYERGPASKAGIRQGDILTAIGDHHVVNKSDYFQALSSYTIDDTFKLGIIRDGRGQQVRMRMSTLPAGYAREFTQQWLGIKVTNVSRKSRQHFRLAAEEGVVLTHVLPNGVCGQAGIQPGDVIRRVNRDKVKNQSDFEKAILEASKLSSVVLLVQRGRSGYYVTLEP